METKHSVRFSNKIDTKSYQYDVVEIPRIGEYVTIYDNATNGKSLLEGVVLNVRWVFVDSESGMVVGITVVLDDPST